MDGSSTLRGRESFFEDIYIIYTLHIIPLTRSKANHSNTFSDAQGSSHLREFPTASPKCICVACRRAMVALTEQG